MSKITTVYAAAMLAVAAVPATATFAFAQPVGHGGVALADHSFRASKLIGMTVVNAKGEELGTIVDILVKKNAAEPMVVLSVDATKMVVVPMNHLTVKDETVTMAGTKAKVMAMRTYEFTGLAGGGG